jgi:hypothetical protein
VSSPPSSLLALLTALLLAWPAWGQTPNPDLSRARQFLDGLRYAEAARALEAARARPGNDRDTLLQILELQGVVAAMLQQPAKASAAFQTLVVLAPEHRLTGDYAPRVVTPFFEAKAWVVEQRAALRLEAAPASKTDATIDGVAVQVTSDVLKLARTVRFHLSADGAPWRQEERPLVEGRSTVAVRGERVQWWAELLDERRAVLSTVGSATAPLRETAPRLQAITAAPKPSPGTPELEGPPGSPWRTAAYVLLGAAAGTGAAGGYFGWSAHSARARVEGAPVDERGLTLGLTQREAFALDERARSNAQLANLLFGVAGVTALAGGTLWVLGAPVTVSATPTGVTVGGEFP